MSHSIKMSRVRSTITMAAYPRTAAHILSAIPDSLIATLTARELTAVSDALHNHWQAARALEARAICEGGAVWDERQQRYREITS